MTVASGEHAVDENAELRSKVRSLEARLAMMISPPGPESTKEVLSSETSASGRGVSIHFILSGLPFLVNTFGFGLWANH